MHIEVLEFYPLKKDDRMLTGTLRIKLPDLGIHILGIYVTRKKDAWFFNLPGKQATDLETGAKVYYPCIAFEDRNQQKELMSAIRQKAPTFIEKRLTDTESPLIFLQKQQNTSRYAAQTKASDNAPGPKKEASISRANSKQKILSKEWRDPPKKKPAFAKSRERR